MSENRRGIKSDETLIRIIEAIYDLDGAPLQVLADEASVSKSTVHRHLTTLRDHGYVRKHDEEYELSFKFLELGGYVRARSRFSKQIKTTLREIAEQTNEFVGFVVEEHGLGIYIYTEWGQKGVQHETVVGKRIHLSTSAAGKSILARLPDERVSEILQAHGLPAETDHTITSSEDLFTELETIRERGYAYARDEFVEGLWAVGVPVNDPDEHVIGGIVVAGPTHRMQGDRFERELPELLKSSIRELELNMEYR